MRRVSHGTPGFEQPSSQVKQRHDNHWRAGVQHFFSKSMKRTAHDTEMQLLIRCHSCYVLKGGVMEEVQDTSLLCYRKRCLLCECGLQGATRKSNDQSESASVSLY